MQAADVAEKEFWRGDRVILADTFTCKGMIAATTETQAIVEWDSGRTGVAMFRELEHDDEEA